MLKLKSALLASILFLPLLAGEALAATAGVTAAVNQNAKSIPPGGGVRTIVLGDNVVQDERIETDGAGLVQILLADGTTFTVGPNSSLVIDRFVYDPDANTAEVAASLGRGVFRFIGGRTSKTEGGVTLNTPVGTVGIRGGMADLNFSGTGGNIAQIDLLFGNEITLNGPNGGDRLFQPGYSIVIGPNGRPAVVKTPPGSASIIQQALAGRPGSTGGASQQPSDDDVEESGVDEANSGSTPPDPQDIPPPDLNAIDLATPKPTDIHQVADGLYGPQDVGKRGFSGGILVSSVENSDTVYPVPLHDYAGKTRVELDENGHPISGTLVVGIESGSPSDLYEGIFVDLISKDRPGANSDTLTIAYNENAVWTASAETVITTNDDPICTGCDFVDWGLWTTEVSDGLGTLTVSGNWIVGDVTTAQQYETTYGGADPIGMLSYTGAARGQAMASGGTEAFDVLGGMSMEWDLASREGLLSITNLMGGDMTTGYDFDADVSEGEFAGMFSGYGITEGEDGFMSASGAFVNDGNAIGAGVIGSFSAYHLDGSTPDFIASGVFAGDATPPPP